MKATEWHRARAADPTTAPAELSALVAAYPELHVAVAANPSCPDDLFDWLSEYSPALGGRPTPASGADRPVAGVDVPLSVPLYGASLPRALTRYFRSYATFTGRASRSEYWWIALVNVMALVAFGALALSVGAATGTTTSTGVIMGPGVAAGLVPLGIWFLATVIPGLAITVRRLHDANFSGATLLLGLIPYLGELILLIFTLLPPHPAGARFDAPRG